jgi:lipid-A-disaccharide synthase-like uncharacterized protein
MDANIFLLAVSGVDAGWFYRDTAWWKAVGYLGNAVFASRFVLQWFHSERRKELIVPPIFWHLSFWGSLISLIYAFHVGEMPFILSFIFLPFLYGRNLMLLYKKQGSPAPKAS